MPCSVNQSHLHAGLVVSRADDVGLADDLVNVVDVGLAELDARRRCVLLEVLDRGRACPISARSGDKRTRDNIVAAREDPGEDDLPGGGIVSLRDLLEVADDLEVLLEVVALEARVVSPVQSVHRLTPEAHRKSPSSKSSTDL